MNNIICFRLFICFIYIIVNANGIPIIETQHILEIGRVPCDYDYKKACFMNGGRQCLKIGDKNNCICQHPEAKFNERRQMCTSLCGMDFERKCKSNGGEKCLNDGYADKCICRDSWKTFDHDHGICIDWCAENEKQKCLRNYYKWCRNIYDRSNCTCKTLTEVNEYVETCEGACDIIRYDGKSWSKFCESIGADCVQDYNVTCKCYNGSKFEDNYCKESCEMIRTDGKSWSEFCESIGADCVEDYNVTCKCYNGSKFEDNYCKETCEMIRIDGKSWSEYCRSIGADCVEGYNATCKCHNGSKFENDYCRETCEVIRDDGISWWKYCASLNARCITKDEVATCVCPYGFRFVNGYCKSEKRNNCWKNCLNGGNCTFRGSRQICECPIEFWGENCEKVNFCKIHHQDGLSGEDYCERGDAKCLNDDRLNCHCYNPHRYFDYESGTCINPCTTWPCRNGGTCIFNENRNSTCLCTPYFTGDRCEYVNWCKVKRISGKSAEDYCLAYGAHCELTGSGRVGCHCNDSYSEFDYSLHKCVEIDMCARNRKGFQVCYQKNAICKNDRFAKSGNRYTCECPPETVLENGICKKRDVCEKGEKGHEVCNRLNAECKLNSSISNGFECQCSPEYAPNNHGRCIDTKICYEGHQGFSDCNRRDAVCLRNFDNEIGYQCECRPGYKKSKIGRCNEITECDEGEVGFLECSIKNAVCVRDVSRYKRYFCVCPENYGTDRSGRCLKNYHGNMKNNENNIISDDDLCQKGNIGYKKCLKENAICIVSTENNSFSCHCRPKQRKNSNETCTDLNICEQGELGYEECTLLSAKCVKVANLQKGYECKCTEAETEDLSGRCIKL